MSSSGGWKPGKKVAGFEHLEPVKLTFVRVSHGKQFFTRVLYDKLSFTPGLHDKLACIRVSLPKLLF